MNQISGFIVTLSRHSVLDTESMDLISNNSPMDPRIREDDSNFYKRAK